MLKISILSVLLLSIAGPSLEKVIRDGAEATNSSLVERGPWNGALVHYYWDGDCKDFANEVHVTDGWMNDNKCMQYYIAGAWSMNVVDCWNSRCYCTFYTDTNCKNAIDTSANYWNYNCVKDNGVAVRSLTCAYLI